MKGNQQQLGLDLLLLEGRADGPIHVQIPDTKYDLYLLHRTSLEEYRNHQKMNLSGIYFILGDLEAEEDNLYIGQAAVRQNNGGCIKRVLEHIGNRKHLFCERVVLLVAPPEDFGATELCLLEDTFITLAREAGRSRLSNKTGAYAGKVREHLKNRMGVIVSNTRLMLATMGIMILEPPIPSSEQIDITLGQGDDAKVDSHGPARKVSREFYSHKRPSQRATLVRSGDEWVLKKGSYIGRATGNRAVKLRNHYSNMFSDNTTSVDIAFKSPNLAGVFVAGNNTNARVFWKDADGRTLGEYQENGEI
ncbi:hypothetical protein ACN08X_00560 [Rothia sp. P6271]|uniref:hypothetical protein n=1 Tax=Rothia sp. P6271 TaxID=3402659 RepID=UPI003AD70E7C